MRQASRLECWKAQNLWFHVRLNRHIYGRQRIERWLLVLSAFQPRVSVFHHSLLWRGKTLWVGVPWLGEPRTSSQDHMDLHCLRLYKYWENTAFSGSFPWECTSTTKKAEDQPASCSLAYGWPQLSYNSRLHYWMLGSRDYSICTSSTHDTYSSASGCVCFPALQALAGHCDRKNCARGCLWLWQRWLPSCATWNKEVSLRSQLLNLPSATQESGPLIRIMFSRN